MRISIRLYFIIALALLLIYKYYSSLSGHAGFTQAIEMSYGGNVGYSNFFTADVQCMLALIGILLISYLPVSQVADDVEDIWSAQRRARVPAR